MQRLILLSLLTSAFALAQSSGEAAELLRKVQAAAETTKNWRAGVVVTSQITGGGMNLHSEVRVQISAQTPLRMSRRNSGDDRTILVCDGTEFFYTGDLHSYYRNDAKVNPDCEYPLSRFYNLQKEPTAVSIVGRDRVPLAGVNRECLLVRATWEHAGENATRTMCIDPDSALILRDVAETENRKMGVRSVTTTVFISYESNPVFPPDAFKFIIPPGAVEAKAPI
jgi:outer membrane lipoprotein-sorting protein